MACQRKPGDDAAESVASRAYGALVAYACALSRVPQSSSAGLIVRPLAAPPLIVLNGSASRPGAFARSDS